MKSAKLLLVLLLWISACNKDNDEPGSVPDRTINISGQMVDAKTQTPIGNWRIRAEALQINSSWEYVYEALDYVNTTQDGRFELAFPLDYDIMLDYINLRLDSVPPGYQPGARINGKLCRVLAKEWILREEAFLKDNGVYLVELFPFTKARLLKPVIPAGYAQDTLVLDVENLVEDPSNKGWELASLGSSFEFRMYNSYQWQNLAKVRYLNLGDQLDFTYTIKNGVVKKTGAFSVQCAMGDTTDIVLPLWE